MWENLLNQLLNPNNRGRLIGVIVGLLFGVFAVVFGFLKALFIAASILIGYIVGKKADEQGNFKNLLDKVIKRD